MASIHKDIPLPVPPDMAWEALADFGAVHERVAPGFVVACRLDGDDRVVTFANGAVARERLVTLDGRRRRLAYTVVEGPLGSTHHQASVTVAASPGGCVLEWTTDVLPHEHAAVIESMMDLGAAAMAGRWAEAGAT